MLACEDWCCLRSFMASRLTRRSLRTNSVTVFDHLMKRHFYLLLGTSG